jgi:hypothetical protein
MRERREEKSEFKVQGSMFGLCWKGEKIRVGSKFKVQGLYLYDTAGTGEKWVKVWVLIFIPTCVTLGHGCFSSKTGMFDFESVTPSFLFPYYTMPC